MDQQSFWGQKLDPKQKMKIPIEDDKFTKLTSISLGEIQNENNNIVSIEISSILIDQIQNDEAPEEKTNIDIILTPNKKESEQFSFKFSTLNTVEITNNGPNVVYISGYFEDFDLYSEEEELFEEEEEEQNKQLDGINKQIIETVQKPKSSN